MDPLGADAPPYSARRRPVRSVERELRNFYCFMSSDLIAEATKMSRLARASAASRPGSIRRAVRGMRVR